MMQISQEQVDEYRELCLKENGVTIDSVSARDELMALVCLLDAVHRHMEQHNWPDVTNG